MTIDSNLTLGQYLRHEREIRGLTIEQVASATKIGIRTLHSLESDHYADLPAKPFIRGFVISYARFIGLDYKETLTHFNSFLDERVKEERPNREGGHSGYAFEKRDGDQSRLFLGITMGGFVVIGAVALIFLKPSLKRHHGSHIDKLRAVHEEASPGTADAAPSSAAIDAKPGEKQRPQPLPSVMVVPLLKKMLPQNSPSPSGFVSSERVLTSPGDGPSPAPSPSVGVAVISAVPDPLNSGFGLKPSETSERVVCKALDSVWVRYRVDNKPTMQFILKKDKVLVLRGHTSIVLQVGEPEHLNVSVNGGPYHAAAIDKNNTMRQNDATLFFPAQLSKTIDEPFDGEKPLSSKKSPSSKIAPESSTPNP